MPFSNQINLVPMYSKVISVKIVKLCLYCSIVKIQYKDKTVEYNILHDFPQSVCCSVRMSSSLSNLAMFHFVIYARIKNMFENIAKSTHGVAAPKLPAVGDILEKFRDVLKKIPRASETEKSKCEQCWQ